MRILRFDPLSLRRYTGFVYGECRREPISYPLSLRRYTGFVYGECRRDPISYPLARLTALTKVQS
jgi:hypothetical protein